MLVDLGHQDQTVEHLAYYVNYCPVSFTIGPGEVHQVANVMELLSRTLCSAIKAENQSCALHVP